MKLLALNAFADNYIWMLHNGKQALVVDPGDPAPVQHMLDAQGLELSAILVTHHHGDHVGGLKALAKPHIPVYGPAHENIVGVTHPCAHGDTVAWGGLSFEVMDTPGHTRGHIAYHCQAVALHERVTPLVFVGDTLFSGGCGRVFDGTIRQLHDSISALKLLPDDTLLCPAHEYTLSNLKFALAVEPDNADMIQTLKHSEALRAQNLPTLPCTMGVERLINPFLRSQEPAVVARAMQQGCPDSDSLSVFTMLRSWKNEFR